MEDHNTNPFTNPDIDDLIDTDERRTSGRRLPVVEPTFVWVSLDRHIQSRLVDESDGGIGVLVSDCQPFEIGFQVRVELGDEKRPAVIVHVTELEPELYRLGLEWE